MRLKPIPAKVFAWGARIALWPARVAAARAALRQLAAMDARGLADIGLAPQDIRDATAVSARRGPDAASRSSPPGADRARNARRRRRIGARRRDRGDAGHGARLRRGRDISRRPCRRRGWRWRASAREFLTAARAAIAGARWRFRCSPRAAGRRRGGTFQARLGALCLAAGFPGFTVSRCVRCRRARRRCRRGVAARHGRRRGADRSRAAFAGVLGLRPISAPAGRWTSRCVEAAARRRRRRPAAARGRLRGARLRLVGAIVAADAGARRHLVDRRVRPARFGAAGIRLASAPIRRRRRHLPGPALVYLGAMSMYFGFFAWNAGLALGGVARVSQVQLVQTFLTCCFRP